MLLATGSMTGCAVHRKTNKEGLRALGSAREVLLGVFGQDASDSKSNCLHVDIFRFCFNSYEVYSTDSSKMTGIFPEGLNFNRLFLELNRFIYN